MYVTVQYGFTCNEGSTVTSHTSLHHTQTYYVTIIVKRSVTEQRATQAATELTVGAYSRELQNLLE